MRKACVILAALALAGAAAGLWQWRAARARQAALEAARRAACERFGVATDGKSPFVALPGKLPHHFGRAQIGQTLAADKRLACSKWRTCVACHSYDGGGTDSQIHSGRLTRPFANAVLGTVFLREGTCTNFTEAVRVMLEDGRYANGGPLSNTVARLARDEGLAARFAAAFEDGLTEANVLAAFEAHARTRLTSETAFDAWCRGRADALTEAQRAGAAVFAARDCTACHTGPALGGFKTHNGKKVSPLRGLSLRRLYLTDGSANDLAAVLARMPGGDAEGETRANLLDFLRSL